MPALTPVGQTENPVVSEELSGTLSPVLITAFNRPGLVRPVIDAVRLARPKRMYLAVDGPRQDRPADAAGVAEVQRLLLECVDWDCEVKTLFRDENLGCARAVSSAIEWFFTHEEEGIILEDDCVPNPDFFRFCDELLDRYRDDPEVMHISGSCLIDIDGSEQSYFMSMYPQVWGWATWRESWSAFSLDRVDFVREIPVTLERFGSADERAYWQPIMELVFAGGTKSWAYPWAYSIWRAGGVSVYPTRNMVRNIGYGKDATHTRSWTEFRGIPERKALPIGDISHPASLGVRIDLDAEVFKGSYRKPLLPIIAAKALTKRVARLASRVQPRKAPHSN